MTGVVHIYCDAAPVADVPVVVPDDGTIRMEPDRDLSERELRIDGRLAYLTEVDALETGEAQRLFDALEELRAEVTRRAVLRVQVVDPTEPTLEERLGEFGLEWQLEQRERQEGGW